MEMTGIKWLCKSGNTTEKYSANPIADAAIGAENPTINDNQPLKNPKSGWKSFEIKTNSPPALGNVAPNSPNEMAPQNEIIPPIIHK